ncbi:MAG: dephospho-CoA kinase, partial [Deferribacterota bacterium]|nr:dephospho-CoA kinase [Deferribacterota bacterium]
MYVGLTGTIASGKSTAAKIFNNLGAFTIDLDKISKELLNINNIGYNEVVNFFGKGILAKDDSIDRAKLKNIIFRDKSYKKALEDILHPLIRKKEIEIVNNILSKNKSPIIIVHAALFIETQSFKRYDSLIVVYSKNDTCYKRLLKRDNIDEG